MPATRPLPATSATKLIGRWFGPCSVAAPSCRSPTGSRLVDLGILVLTYVMLGWGLNIVVGLAGLLDLGYVAFYAVGAYSYALLAAYFGWSFWVCLPLAGLLAACWGIMLGFPVLRLRGDYLAIVTLGFGEIIRIILTNWWWFTGGPNGINEFRGRASSACRSRPPAPPDGTEPSTSSSVSTSRPASACSSSIS